MLQHIFESKIKPISALMSIKYWYACWKEKSDSRQGFKIANSIHFVEFAKTISVNVTLTKHPKERHIWVILWIYFVQTFIKDNISF